MIFKEVKKSTNLFAAPVSGDSWTIQLDLEPVDNPSFASLKAGTLVSQPPLTAPRASHNFSTPLSSGGDRVFQPPPKSQLTHQSGDSITLPRRSSVDFQAPGQQWLAIAFTSMVHIFSSNEDHFILLSKGQKTFH